MITAGAGICLVLIIYFFGRTVPVLQKPEAGSPQNNLVSIDSILLYAKEKLSPDQVTRINEIEHSIVRGAVKEQQLDVYHQLQHFWRDTGRNFEAYAWYEAESARLENSEKSLTFAAHLFLNNLQVEGNPGLKKWKALQAKDLFERSLIINPGNDSSSVGLGACYLFGNITDSPMEGIILIRKVVEKDSSNIYAHMMLGYGSILSKQYDKAISRFEKVIQLQPDNLEAIFNIAEAYERKGDVLSAIKWYEKSLQFLKIPAFKAEIDQRIAELKK